MAYIDFIVYSAHCYSLNHVKTFTDFKHNKRIVIYASLLWHQLRRKNGTNKNRESKSRQKPDTMMWKISDEGLVQDGGAGFSNGGIICGAHGA